VRAIERKENLLWTKWEKVVLNGVNAVASAELKKEEVGGHAVRKEVCRGGKNMKKDARNMTRGDRWKRSTRGGVSRGDITNN